jgi:pyruvate,water dikinase
VGTEVRAGRAVVIDDPDALSRVEPGDVLRAVPTTGAHNAVFPYVAAVATEEGDPLSHTAILSRELDVTVVVGVTDLMARVSDGATFEVDAMAGTVRVADRPWVGWWCGPGRGGR